MSKLQQIYVSVGIVGWLAGGVQAEMLAEYDADVDNPASAASIQNPAAQGWTEAGTGNGVTVEGVVDGSINAWGISDDASNLNPSYTTPLSASDLTRMYLNGWEFEMVVRAIRGSENGGFCAWGVSVGNDPGWGLSSQERVGFGIDYVAGTDAFQVTPTHGGTVTLGPGSAGTFHTIRCVGSASSPQYEFLLDGVPIGVFDIRDGSSNNNYDDVVRFASGSTAGTGREAAWNRIQLTSDPLRIVVAPTDGTTVVDEEGPTSDSFTVQLAQYPTATVTVTVAESGSSADLDLGAGPGVAVDLVFSQAGWDTPQTVSVTAVDDAIEESDEVVFVAVTGSSGDTTFDGVQATLPVTVLDNDLVFPQPDITAEVFVSPKGSFVTDPDMYHTFRIPSLLAAPDGSLLAFAEGRRGTGADPRRQDNAPIDLVVRRSTDHGLTWGPMDVIDPGFQTNGWQVDFGDPTTVVDETADPPTIVLLYGQWTDYGPINPIPGNDPNPAAVNQVVWCRTSIDNGLSWSERTQVMTPVGPSDSPISPDGLYWRYMNPGPGNGIQLQWQEGANAGLNGRLIMPAKRSGSTTPDGSTTVEPVMFFSDDHGATWQVGNVTAGPNANEDEVVELTNGQVLLDARQNSGSFRRRHLSDDAGANWGSNLGDDVAITAVDCSVDRYSARREGDDRDRVLFSGPLGSPVGSGSGRYNLAVWTSYDEGASFINPVQVNEGFAAYSVVRTLPDGSIGTFVETASDSGATYGKIEYFGFGLEYLEGMTHSASLTHYDGFGNRIDRARGGTGWSGAWGAGPTFSGGSEDALGSASVGYDGFDLPTTYGRMDLIGAQSTARDLARGIDLGSDDLTYISLLVSRQLDTSPNGTSDEALSIELRDAGDAMEASFGVDSDEAFFVDGLGTRQSGPAGELTMNQSYLLVLKIVANAGGGDQVLLKVYPTGTGGPDPSDGVVAWTVTGSTTEDAVAVLEKIAIVGSAEAHWSVDEIRIGETWGSVTGEDQLVPDPDDANLWAWFDAGDSNTVNGSGIDLDGDPVSTWLDRTTTGLHSLLRSTDGNATYSTNVINGFPAVRYPGDVDTWGAASAGGEFQTLPNAYSLVCIARLNDIEGTDYVFDRSTRGGGVGLRIAYDADYQWEALVARSTGAPGIDVQFASTNVLFGVFQTHILVVDGVNLHHYVDGALVASGSFDDGGVPLNQGGLILGADVGTENDADCDIAEFLAYSIPLSTGEVQSLSTHFTDKYDLTSQTPIPPPPPPPTPPPHVDVFTNGEGGYPRYRIPALLTTSAGSVLAFCEARQGADHSQNDIVLRRSLDMGETWLPMQVLFDNGGDSLNDPLVVQVREGTNAGRIFLFFMSFPEGCHTGCVQPGYGPDSSQNYMMSSDDDGVTWSSPSNVSTIVRSPVSSAAGTPGQGIQMRHGPYAGRLVFTLRRWPSLEMYALYSDDGGDTWTRGAEVDESQVDGGGDEVQVAELANGTLMLNTRRSGGAALRKIAYSFDGGATWTPLEDSTLIEPTCDAGFHRFTDPLDAQSSRLLYVGPYSTSSRVNGSVHLSYDEGTSWPVRKTIYSGGYAYSKVTTLPDNRIGVLFERDGYAHISFSAVTLDWLTDDEDLLAGPGSPAIETDGASAVEVQTAFLNATLTSTGTAATTVSVFWGPADGAHSEAAWGPGVDLGIQTEAPPVALTHALGGLNAGDLTYYRYRAGNVIGTNWSPISSFTALDDRDGDGISDDWELAYCGSITGCTANAQTGDGDGYTYLDEYLLDFDPAVSNAPFVIASIAAMSPIEVAFGPTSAQRMYTLEWSSNLTESTGWQVLQGVPGSEITTSVVDPTAAGERHYRVRAP